MLKSNFPELKDQYPSLFEDGKEEWGNKAWSPYDWQNERKNTFTKEKLESLPLRELADNAYFEIIRDFTYPNFSLVCKTLASRLFKDSALRKVLRVDYVWPVDGWDGFYKTIDYLNKDSRTIKEHNYLVNHFDKFKGIILLATLHFPLTDEDIYKLIETHVEDTKFCSTHGLTESTTWPFIKEVGERAIPIILKYLKNEGGGVHVCVMLSVLSHDNPYKGSFFKKDPGNVRHAMSVWLEWGKRKGYIK